MKTLLRTVIFFFTAFASLHAQVKEFELKNADLLFGEKKFNEALPAYLHILSSDSSNALINYRAGICYFNSRSQKPLSLIFLERSVRDITASEQLEKIGIPPDVFKTLGDVYHQSYNFDKAIYSYERFKAISASSSSNEEIDWKIDMCKVGKALSGLTTMPLNQKKEKAGKNGKGIAHSNYSSYLSADQSKMVFTFDRKDSKINMPEENSRYYDDPGMNKRDSVKTSVQNVKFEKKNMNEATIATSYDGQIVLNYRDEEGNANLYITALNGNTWSLPEKVSKAVNTGWEENECISADGHTMYFTSSRKGGYGGKDIYMCKKTEEGEWGKAINLGPTVNTPYDDEAPFIHPDGRTLFFSSNGRQKIGHYDIFSTSISPQGWTFPVNVGFPIDSTHDIPVVADKKLVVALPDKKLKRKKHSSKTDTEEIRDNYLVSFNNTSGQPLTLLKEKISEASGSPGNVLISVVDNANGETNAFYYSDSVKNDLLILLPPGKNNNITYNKKGFMPYSENIDLSTKTELYEKRQPVTLLPVNEGSSVVLNNIFFGADRTDPEPTSDPALKNIFLFLKNNPDVIVELENRIVARQDIKHNSRVSQGRAEVVMNRMVSEGISKDRLSAKGTAMKIKRSPEKKAGQYMELRIIERMPSENMLTTKRK